jgi:hypothetical protein
MKTNAYYVVAGTSLVILVFLLGDWFPPLAYINFPGFFGWGAIFGTRHVFGADYRVGGLVLNSALYSLLFLLAGRLIFRR